MLSILVWRGKGGKGWNGIFRRNISTPWSRLLTRFVNETSLVSQLSLLHGLRGGVSLLTRFIYPKTGLWSREAMWLRWRKKVIESHAITRMEFLPSSQGRRRKKGNERAIFRRRLLKLYSNVTLERNLFTFFSSLNYQYFFLFLKLFSQTNAFSGTKSSHKHSI